MPEKLEWKKCENCKKSIPAYWKRHEKCGWNAAEEKRICQHIIAFCPHCGEKLAGDKNGK